MTSGELPEAEYAAMMLACPYLMHGGNCVTGCTSEPSCMTEAPEGGWETILRPTDDEADVPAPEPDCEDCQEASDSRDDGMTALCERHASEFYTPEPVSVGDEPSLAVREAWAEHSSMIGRARWERRQGRATDLDVLAVEDRAKTIVESAIRAPLEAERDRLRAFVRFAADLGDEADVLDHFPTEEGDHCETCRDRARALLADHPTD